MENRVRVPALDLTEGSTRAAALATLRAAFRAAGIGSDALDARLLLTVALEADATTLLANPDVPLRAGEAERLAALASRRLAREPVTRILGEAEFWGLPFRLSPETLVPRPDTEAVVEAALDAVRTSGRAHSILDLGTGSGCILVALLSELPDGWGIGIDRAPRALATATANAAANGVAPRAAFVAADWTSSLSGRFGLIVSNPPYIRAGEIPLLAPEVARFDPLAALDGGDDGLDAYRAILSDAARLLTPGGRVVLELGHDQADSVGGIADDNGFVVHEIRADLGGHRRALVLARDGEP